MLEIAAKTITLEPSDVIELERITADQDCEKAYAFLKKIYKRLEASQGHNISSGGHGCRGSQSR